MSERPTRSETVPDRVWWHFTGVGALVLVGIVVTFLGWVLALWLVGARSKLLLDACTSFGTAIAGLSVGGVVWNLYQQRRDFDVSLRELEETQDLLRGQVDEARANTEVMRTLVDATADGARRAEVVQREQLRALVNQQQEATRTREVSARPFVVPSAQLLIEATEGKLSWCVAIRLSNVGSDLALNVRARAALVSRQHAVLFPSGVRDQLEPGPPPVRLELAYAASEAYEVTSALAGEAGAWLVIVTLFANVTGGGFCVAQAFRVNPMPAFDVYQELARTGGTKDSTLTSLTPTAEGFTLERVSWYALRRSRHESDEAFLAYVRSVVGIGDAGASLFP